MPREKAGLGEGLAALGLAPPPSELGKRAKGRRNDSLRDIEINLGVSKWAEGSCEIYFGDTNVLCTASVEKQVPFFRRNSGLGWVTAEYGMLPRSTGERRQRTGSGSRPDSRALEISRLIGRSLRSVVDFAKLGERVITIDCDVIQADGGTRTAAITGAYVAMVEAMRWCQRQKLISQLPLKDPSGVAAISVGIVNGETLLDLDYSEDSHAMVDLNVVMTGRRRLIELQGTGEERSFSRDELNALLDLAEQGIAQLALAQQEALNPAAEAADDAPAQ